MPSQIELRTTKDGRKRAPQKLFGVHHIKPFPWIRVLAACGAVYAFYYQNYAKDQAMTPQMKFIKKVKVVPYGVLGTQLTLQGSLVRVAPEPDEKTVIVDPAGLKYIHSLAANAGGAAGAIYNWLGLRGEFPEEVRRWVSKVCDAKLYEYAEGSKKVIHAVGPDFRQGEWSEREAAIELSRAYRNALHEFVTSEGDNLRLLPLSGGVFAGPLYNQLPPITQQALIMAFEQLHQFDREFLLREQKSVELCIFMNREWDMYKSVFENVTPSSKL
mmetsp:Transcript_8597/g.9698  ORF Transcript_8597/g.9698 Transcript_8597/m.9698 type:complete len:272 (+) Transcript_8597:50-865(+)